MCFEKRVGIQLVVAFLIQSNANRFVISFAFSLYVLRLVAGVDSILSYVPLCNVV